MPKPIFRQNIPIAQEEVAFWQREIQSSQDFQQKQFIDRVGYKSNIDFYEGLQKAPFAHSIDMMAIINEVTPSANSVIASTYNQNPTATVTALHPLAEENLQPPIEFILNDIANGGTGEIPAVKLTELMKGALDHGILKTDFKEANQIALFDILHAGYACVEVNHLSKSVEAEFKGSETPEDERTLADKVADSLVNSVETGVKRMLGIDSQESREEINERMESEQGDTRDLEHDATYVEWWNPLDILFDYRAKVFSKSRYIVKKVRLTVAEFDHRFPEYAGQAREDSKEMMDFAQHGKDENKKTVLVHEIQIKKKEGCKILVLSEGIQEALEHYDCPVITDGFTVKYTSLDKYGTLYPIPVASLARKAQIELNHYATIEMEHADRSHRKVGVYVEGLTKNGREQVKSPDVYAIVEKSTPNIVFEPMPTGGVAPENESLQQKMAESINKMFRTNELSKSGKSDSKFATQDQLKAQSFETSTSQVADAIGDLVRQELNTMKDIIMQLWDGNEFFKITGLQGGAFWYTPEMGPLADILKGDYLIKVDITTAQRANPFKDRIEAQEAIATVTSDIVALLAGANNKKISWSFIESQLKKMGINPDTAFEDIAPISPEELPQEAGLNQSQESESPPPTPEETENIEPAPGVPLNGVTV